MRKAIFRTTDEAALELLRAAPAVHLATSHPDGRPILRTVHGVLLEGDLYFHGAPAGEKMAGIGRQAVVSAEEIVAEVPSYFSDPESACPATTFFRSVMAHGRLERIDEPTLKARALQALMERYQPEGGHVPITADHPLYAKALRGLLIARLRIERIDGKAKLGQHRKSPEIGRILERLWERGRPEDLRAIEIIAAANPEAPVPKALLAPEGARLCVVPGEDALIGALELVRDEYWNTSVDSGALERSHRGASAWIVARDDGGAIVGTARALSDTGKIAWILDVAVAPRWRAKGLGSALMRALVAHPRVRSAREARLATRDAQPFYERFGFEPVSEQDWPRFPVMARKQSSAQIGG